MNEVYRVKGMCEECGFAFKGEVTTLSEIKCPKCSYLTENFDEEYAVDELNKVEEHGEIIYEEVKFENK